MKIPFKRGDLLVYAWILLLTGGSFFGLHQMRVRAEHVRILVELDGRLIGSYAWDPETPPQEIFVDAGDGRYNITRITEMGIDIQEANCPDQICVRSSRIRSPGHAIVCLPHRVVIRLVGQPLEPPEIDDIAS